MLCSRNFQVFHTNYRKTITKWVPVGLVRMKSSAEPKTKTYSHTILFPKTDFPARSNSARKDEIQESAKFSDLYNWQREHLKGPEFVLHDGPPYANGDLHMGHAINKIIKDINNRHQVLQGNRVHYVPGWDCHGLPIELKALQQTKKGKQKPSTPVEIRKVARKFALETIERQKEQFKSWGVMADWDGQCYRTLDNGYVKKQLELFYEMYEKGLIFRALKPVYWSPSSQTALAEAELEYDTQFKSTEVYVSFPLDAVPAAVQEAVQGETLSAIIWTTTPWTLVANRAICFHPQLTYSVVRIDGLSGRFLVASALVEELQKTLERGVEKTAEVEGLEAACMASILAFKDSGLCTAAVLAAKFSCHIPDSMGSPYVLPLFLLFNTSSVMEGQQLAGARYYHKILGRSFPLLGAGHVSASKGTGLVHTAPAHGPEDFLVGLEHNIPVECNVDESGLYTNLGALDGLYVLGEGQETVISLLGHQVLRRGVHTHSYPLDWRTKKPVILRASHQWFIHTEALKKKALEALEQVQILPPSTAAQSRAGLRARVGARPAWCVSRQRAWGVPLPALYRGYTAEPILHRRIIDRLCALLEERGPDAWWTSSVADLLPTELAEQLGVKVEEVTKGQDIMDIWLDSGSSWQTLSSQEAPRTRGSGAPPAPDTQGSVGPAPAALYSEGVDQLTGWFQSSLLTSVAITGRAPYRCIFVHGFVVDDQKRKMSKSLGNVIVPAHIIHGDGKKPGYGIDTLRWWAASHGTQHTQIIVSKKLFDDCQVEVIRIRAIMKYLLGVIDIPPPLYHNPPPLNYFDQYMVTESYKFLNDVAENMKELRYNSAVQNILYFISNKVSALYCHCVKDRLYCAPKNSKERIAAQLVAHTILVSLCKAIGPILPHLVEEVWKYHPLYKNPFFFTQNIPVLENQRVDVTIMDLVLDLKKEITALAKNENLKKFTVDIKISPNLHNILSDLNSLDETNESVLSEILEVSEVCLREASVSKWEVSVAESSREQCLRCRKYNAQDNSDKCVRCEKAMASL